MVCGQKAALAAAWACAIGHAAFSFYSAFTYHDHSVMWLKVGFFTLLIGIFIYRYLLLHLGFEAA